MSGFQHEPGSPERRAADRDWLELHRVATVKNPSRYNDTTRQAFGIASKSGDQWFVKARGDSVDVYDSVDELLDAGWTVD